MRFSFTLLVCLQLIFISSLLAQHHDTTITVTNASADSIRRLVKEEFERYQDSMQALRINQNVAKNGKSLDALLQEVEERKKTRQRQLWFRIGLGVLFLLVLTVGLARRKRKRIENISN